jgi:ribosomal protein S18 acetylase RimI-like enzyme
MANFIIRPFLPSDQDAAHTLILAGLADHFDILDPTLNPDLEDIQHTYIDRGDIFLVVHESEELIATGALIKEEPGIGRIVRMSVAAHRRRQGIARRLVQELVSSGIKQAYTKIVVETNDDWLGAIRLYEECGFREYDHRSGEIHMALDCFAQKPGFFA